MLDVYEPPEFPANDVPSKKFSDDDGDVNDDSDTV